MGRAATSKAAGAARESAAARAARVQRAGAPLRSYEYVEGWGMAVGARSRVLRPRNIEELAAAFESARRAGSSIALRGSGCSYGDASVNEQGNVLDISLMDRLVHFERETGLAQLEPGCTIAKLWRQILPLGYWPKVVSGTMFPTIAGAAAMNIHGKNNFAVGTIGDAIEEFDLLTPRGELLTCNRTQHADLFHAAIGGFGMLGAFTRIVLHTKRVHSGELEVRAYSNRDLHEMMDYFEAEQARADYLVGWIDCFARGDALGRGLVHAARYLEPGEDLEPERTLRVEHQELPAHILGFPKSEVWRILRLIRSDLGVRLLNASKYTSGRMEAMGEPHRQAHAAFAFLLDYVPNWKWAYGRGGLIQYQSFVPKESAREVYPELLRMCHASGHVPYLGVFKRHRPDPFWLTHSNDGWSFAMDFCVRPEQRASLWAHCARMTEVVLAGRGKFYFAKDLVIGQQDMLRMFPSEKREAFLALKRLHDPDGLLQTNLWRRVFSGAGAAAAPAP